jgi:hypothetical protein
MLLFLLSGTVIYSLAGICGGCGGVGIYLVMVPYSQPNHWGGGAPLVLYPFMVPFLSQTMSVVISSSFLCESSGRTYKICKQLFSNTIPYGLQRARWNYVHCASRTKISEISCFITIVSNFQRERRHLGKFILPEENNSPTILREVEKKAKVLSS